MRIRDKMMPSPLFLKPEQTAFTAKELMLLNDLEALYVVDDDKKPIGVVTSVAASAESSRTKVDKLMSPDIITVYENQPLREAALIFAKKDYNRVSIPVVDKEGRFIGVVRVRELIGVMSEGPDSVLQSGTTNVSVELTAVKLALCSGADEEREMLEIIEQQGRYGAVTQVGASAEKLLIKMREAAVVASIAHGVIRETSMEKVAVTIAIRDIINQMEMVSPGLGGGYKLGVVRGEGRVSVCAFGRCGHALANSPEQIFLGTAVI